MNSKEMYGFQMSTTMTAFSGNSTMNLRYDKSSGDARTQKKNQI
jgi:hypothetical protein